VCWQYSCLNSPPLLLISCTCRYVNACNTSSFNPLRCAEYFAYKGNIPSFAPLCYAAYSHTHTYSHAHTHTHTHTQTHTHTHTNTHTHTQTHTHTHTHRQTHNNACNMSDFTHSSYVQIRGRSQHLRVHALTLLRSRQACGCSAHPPLF